MTLDDSASGWWSGKSDDDTPKEPEQATSAPTPSAPEKPQHTVALSGEVTAGQGLTTYKGGGLMLSVRPQHGSRKLIPYSRIEEIEINHDGTRCTLYSAASVVTIEGRGFDALESALQRAIAWVIAVGKSDANDVVIDRITITDSAGLEAES